MPRYRVQLFQNVEYREYGTVDVDASNPALANLRAIRLAEAGHITWRDCRDGSEYGDPEVDDIDLLEDDEVDGDMTPMRRTHMSRELEREMEMITPTPEPSAPTPTPAPRLPRRTVVVVAMGYGADHAIRSALQVLTALDKEPGVDANLLHTDGAAIGVLSDAAVGVVLREVRRNPRLPLIDKLYGGLDATVPGETGRRNRSRKSRGRRASGDTAASKE